MSTFENIIFAIFCIFIVCFVVCAITYHIKRCINNNKHLEHESRVVQLKNGKFQVQEWLGYSSPEEELVCDWQEAKSYLKEATFDTVDEAKAAKIEHDKMWEDSKNSKIVDKVIEGPKE